MMKLPYKPVRMLVSAFGAVLAGAIFRKVWKLTGRDDKAPQATEVQHRWREALIAAGLQGAIFGLVKGAVDRVAGGGALKLTGVRSGDDVQSARPNRPSPVVAQHGELQARPQDVTAVIGLQHEHVKVLLDRVRQAAGPERSEAFHTLRLTLALHETAEEQAIHPQALRQLGPYDRPATNRIAEEQTAGQTIGHLELVDVDSDQFNFTFEHLASSVTEHATAEEDEEWPALRRISEIVTIDGMVEQMQAVPRLAEDPAAPGIQATFEEMRQWARSQLPDPPASR